MSTDEKKDDTCQHSLTTSLINGKLAMNLLHNNKKHMYQHLFTSQELQRCGFSDKQAANLQTVIKFIEKAKNNENGFQLDIQIDDTDDMQNASKFVNSIMIKITKEDDLWPMNCTFKLQQIKRDQTDILTDYINDLQQENTQLKIELNAQKNEFTLQIKQLTQRLEQLENKVDENKESKEEEIKLNLINNWVRYGNDFAEARAIKRNGVVYLEGLLKNGTVGSIIAQLPEKWRPRQYRIFGQAQNSNQGCRVDITTNGDIFVQNYQQIPSSWVSLDGIQFVAT